MPALIMAAQRAKTDPRFIDMHSNRAVLELVDRNDPDFVIEAKKHIKLESVPAGFFTGFEDFFYGVGSLMAMCNIFNGTQKANHQAHFDNFKSLVMFAAGNPATFVNVATCLISSMDINNGLKGLGRFGSSMAINAALAQASKYLCNKIGALVGIFTAAVEVFAGGRFPILTSLLLPAPNWKAKFAKGMLLIFPIMTYGAYVKHTIKLGKTLTSIDLLPLALTGDTANGSFKDKYGELFNQSLDIAACMANKVMARIIEELREVLEALKLFVKSKFG